MQHVNRDTLALLALGEDVATPEEEAHLAACPDCRRFVDELADTAAVGRTVLGVERLTPPPPRVWAAISAELGLPSDVAPAAVAVLERPVGEQPAPAHVARRPRRRRALLTAITAVVVLLVAGGAGTVALLHAGQPEIVARASLRHLPGRSGSGSAEIEQYADGRRVVVVTTDLQPSASAGHEVWLMDAATGSRVGLGFLKGRSGAFVLPSHVDLATYSNIDVSAEPHDGDPAPSGDSIIRGPLRS